jgi:hypothetical protein
MATEMPTVPPTVPELPAAYLRRPSDQSALEAALLNQPETTKVCVYGMGGVGKTTIVASLVRDLDARSAFDKAVWVSIGQEPDVRELQNSIHVQLCGRALPEEAKDQDAIGQALKNAAAGAKVLLVLDDIWDSAMEEPFSCVDPATVSRLLVTTRVRGLLRNSTDIELCVLPPDEALKLLLASAEMAAENFVGGDKEHGIAVDIVALCGRLPLTLAIAGGVVANAGQGFTEDILEAMTGASSADLDDEDESTLEERVISSSLKMIKGKNKVLVKQVLQLFAVFPEDVAVPAAVFNALAPLVAGEITGSKAQLAVGKGLGTLLKLNLLKGSIAGAGVFMHDIVRDYAVNLHSMAELQTLQRDVVEAVLAARPQPGGFDGSAGAGSFDGYIVRQLHWHIRGALADGEPPDAWLIDDQQDPVVKSNAAVAVGFEKLEALAAAKENAGLLVHAAKLAWEAGCLKQTSNAVRADLVYRAADLLEQANDPTVSAFESKLLAFVWWIDRGSERNVKSQRRKAVVDDADPYMSQRPTSTACESPRAAVRKLPSRPAEGFDLLPPVPSSSRLRKRGL